MPNERIATRSQLPRLHYSKYNNKSYESRRVHVSQGRRHLSEVDTNQYYHGQLFTVSCEAEDDVFSSDNGSKNDYRKTCELKVHPKIQLPRRVSVRPLADAEKRYLPDNVVNIDLDVDVYEYCIDVVKYLYEIENFSVIPVDYLEDGSVSESMRSILVDWMIQVQHHLLLSQETLYLAVGILDNVLHRRDVDPNNLQLVGITSLLIASKLEEYYPAEIKKLLHLTEDSYDRFHVLQMERTMLAVMEFQVYLPSPQVFLLRFVRAALRSNDPVFLKTCQYMMDSHLHLASHASLVPSLIAASSVGATLLLYEVHSTVKHPEVFTLADVWTPTLVHYTGYKIGALKVVMCEMISHALAACLDSSRFKGAWIKYKSLSQHQRLVLAGHLTCRVLQMGIKIVQCETT